MTPTANRQKRRLTLSPAVRAQSAFVAARADDMRSEFDSQELFSGQRQINIVHNDETYRLSITKQGKLILTK
ncbi:hemin uptake protein HemP [Rhodobacterales bacterium]|nr:hemin uptake protein HemP [Rhodobacterales bacterium]